MCKNEEQKSTICSKFSLSFSLLLWSWTFGHISCNVINSKWKKNHGKIYVLTLQSPYIFKLKKTCLKFGRRYNKKEWSQSHLNFINFSCDDYREFTLSTTIMAYNKICAKCFTVGSAMTVSWLRISHQIHCIPIFGQQNKLSNTFWAFNPAR